MSHRTRRAPAAGALAVAVLLSTAACGSSSGEEDADGTITLTISTYADFGYDELLQEYQDDHPGIVIEQTTSPTATDARDDFNTRLAAGTGLADVAAVEVDWLPELIQYEDQFTDLSDPDLEGRWLDWKEAAATTASGALIGYGTDTGPEAICYRSDLFAAAGLPTDRDEVAALLEGGWDNYFAVGEQFVASSDAAWFDSAAAVYAGLVGQIEYSYEDEDGTIIAADNDEVQAAYDEVTAASTAGLSANLRQWTDDWVSAFQNDAFATMLCPGWMLGTIEGYATDVDGWDVADVFPGGGGNQGGSYLTVPTQSEHPEEAKELAAWLTAPEQQVRAFEASGVFPSTVEAMSSPELLGVTDAFFNDAPTGQIMATRAEAVSVIPYKGENYFTINDLMSDAINRVDVDKTDTAESSWDKFVTAVADVG